MSTTESKPSNDEQLAATLVHCARNVAPNSLYDYDLSAVLLQASERIRQLSAALALPASSGAEPHPDTVLLKEVFDELDDGRSDGPTHCHSVPGIWDMDNGKKAGQPCKWCATWVKVRASLAQAEAAKGVES